METFLRVAGQALPSINCPASEIPRRLQGDYLLSHSLSHSVACSRTTWWCSPAAVCTQLCWKHSSVTALTSSPRLHRAFTKWRTCSCHCHRYSKPSEQLQVYTYYPPVTGIRLLTQGLAQCGEGRALAYSNVGDLSSFLLAFPLKAFADTAHNGGG